MSDSILDKLMLEENHDILWEVTDPKWLGRQHHRAGLYNRGCHGPLCSKARRDFNYKDRPEQRPAETRGAFLEEVAVWQTDQVQRLKVLSKVAGLQARIEQLMLTAS